MIETNRWRENGRVGNEEKIIKRNSKFSSPCKRFKAKMQQREGGRGKIEMALAVM